MLLLAQLAVMTWMYKKMIITSELFLFKICEQDKEQLKLKVSKTQLKYWKKQKKKTEKYTVSTLHHV